MVMDMTAISFLAAFRRFIARRGRPKRISFLPTLLQGKPAEKILEELARRQIDWRYSIDLAPWCSGYWERMV
ncbi:hypothetical protein T4A_14047 [Trichinella pseudospiralis]|uniref:Uncharacterized protein n=1 Tax=Trichinella pseudospiralis TaxID=6337 RepID=A0A0V1ER36_TRIPS|nr:hypothetical protein T4A_14047 [Trichinella pseudospiralis]